MKPVQVQDVEGLMDLNSILILDIDRWVYYIDENTYKPIYAVEKTTRPAGSGTESVLVCNVLEEWRSCKYMACGNSASVFRKRLKSPSYKMNVREKQSIVDTTVPFITITKTVQDNALSIPIALFRFDEDFLFRKVEVADTIARYLDSDEEEEDTEEEKMAKKKFRKRLRQRYWELGYRWR
ncbi:cuticle-degrading protease [Fusarium beomiforme]|uniref:Cuticle-degrading protease n=1 Tax=Fusarium beomiforme TaxID=44412 RepID=A0A9P5ASC9_9HYPO|nr:cuticle-degrading protease [Fusarium beomiforme]